MIIISKISPSCSRSTHDLNFSEESMVARPIRTHHLDSRPPTPSGAPIRQGNLQVQRLSMTSAGASPYWCPELSHRPVYLMVATLGGILSGFPGWLGAKHYPAQVKLFDTTFRTSPALRQQSFPLPHFRSSPPSR